MGLGKALKKATGGIAGATLGMGGGLGKMFGGQTFLNPADPMAKDLKALGAEGIKLQKEGLKQLKSEDPTAGIRSDVTREEKLARRAGEDAKMRAQQRAASQGLAGTSIGQGAIQQADRATAEKMGDIRGSIGGRLRDAKASHASKLMSAGRGLIKQRGPIQMEDKKTRRKGVLGTLLGAGAGAFLGGPQGAQMGASLGGMLDR